MLKIIHLKILYIWENTQHNESHQIHFFIGFENAIVQDADAETKLNTVRSGREWVE